MADVEATIALARLVKHKQSRLFDFYFGLRQKAQADRLVSLAAAKVVLHLSGMFPAHQGCIAPIVPLIQHPVNKNEIICYNLRFAPDALLRLSAEQIREKLYTPRLNLAAGEQRIALKGVHINKSPALAPVNTLSAAQAQRWQINWEQIKQHYALLMSAQGLKEKLVQVYTQEGKFPDKDADSDLYSGFISHTDRQRCQQLLGLKPAQVLTWESDYFQDARLQTLLPRYQARNYAELLGAAETQRWQAFCRARLIEGEFACPFTLEQFQQELMTLVQSQTGEREQGLLNQLSTWVQQRFS